MLRRADMRHCACASRILRVNDEDVYEPLDKHLEAISGILDRVLGILVTHQLRDASGNLQDAVAGLQSRLFSNASRIHLRIKPSTRFFLIPQVYDVIKGIPASNIYGTHVGKGCGNLSSHVWVTVTWCSNRKEQMRI